MTLVVRVEDPALAAVTLYAPLPAPLRLDVLPFVLLYATAAFLLLTRASSDAVAPLFLALSVGVHALAFLAGEWSVDARAWLSCTRAHALPGDGSAHVLAKVAPARATLPKLLCRVRVADKPLQAGGETLSTGERIPVAWFSYQNLHFCVYDGLDAINRSARGSGARAPCFRRLDYPTQNALARYVAAAGYASETELALAGIKWGKNDFDIPVPGFGTLLKEQLVAPFFVFQFFCMLLWCLDEYVYYSLLTLLMLVVFECTVVKQRQRNMEMLSQMRRAPQRCLVYRSRRWGQIWSDQLVPGDICSIGVALQPGVGSAAAGEASVPCDLLLLHGSCIVNESMLSGESVPLRKEAVGAGLDAAELRGPLRADDGSTMRHKGHVLFGGTKVLQHTTAGGAGAPALARAKGVPTPPDQGCVAFVLRTGFGTTQGSLVRTIIYSSQRVTANNAEAMWFIAFLLCFALGAAGVVLHEGLQDASRNRFKLLLHCVMIVTSVVPPELPMELSLAVTNSLIALAKVGVFCTEPFRIPFAGRIDVCCFDKTGTLTSDELTLLGVVGLETRVASDPRAPSGGALDIVAPEHLPLDSELVLAGCQSLVLLNGHVVGDPIELTAVQGIQWNVVFGAGAAAGGTSVQPSFYSSRRGEIQCVDILHRFAFSSEHKRMSTVVRVVKGDNDARDELRVLTKGAPEVLEPLFAAAPAYYRCVYRHFAARGHRVLALGYRPVPADWTLADVRQKSRREVERDLVFAGFIVLDSPLKDDTKRTVRDLMRAKHKVVIVTGDNALTACDVARQVGVNAGDAKQPLILSATASSNAVEWVAIDNGAPEDGAETVPFDVARVRELSSQYDLCVTGEALTALYEQVNEGDENAALEAFLRTLAGICMHVTVGGGGGGGGGSAKSQSFHERLQAMQDEDDANAALVRLGDASIASPFTSKSSSIRIVKQLIRQGRCTLVTTIQMYKILGVNCLVTAYYLSTLYVSGVKNGDQQLTVMG
ncbi:hypothetical protein PybrP1_009517, partial [[Pythium] brassicae (nom. inval.)]